MNLSAFEALGFAVAVYIGRLALIVERSDQEQALRIQNQYLILTSNQNHHLSPFVPAFINE